MRTQPSWCLFLLCGCGFGLGAANGDEAGDACDPTTENCCTGSFDTVRVGAQDVQIVAEAVCPDHVAQWLVQLDGATAGSAAGTGPSTPISLNLDLEDYAISDGEHTLALQVTPGGDLPFAEVATATFTVGDELDTGDSGGADTADTADTADIDETAETGSEKLAQLAPGSPALVPASGQAGDTITVYCTVFNEGAADADPNTGQIWWSQDPTLDASDTLLSTFTVGKALADDFAPVTQDVTVPATAPLGEAYLFVSIDVDDVVSESEERDNVVATTFEVDGVDLSSESLDVSPAAGAPGSSVVADWRVKNGGSLDAGPYRVGLYWSADSALDSTDVELTSWIEPGLDAATSTSGSTSLSIPADVTADGTVLLVADPEDTVQESGESNNAATATFDVQFIDLGVWIDGVDAYTIAIGDSFAGNLSVFNEDVDTATSFSVDVYLSYDGALDAGDALLDSISFSYLLGGGTSAISFSGVIPDDAPVGTVYLIAAADPDGYVAETDEADNTDILSIDVAGPDLAPDINSVSPTNVSPGSVTSMTWLVRNWAAVDVAGSITGVYLSTDTAWDASDTLVATLSAPALGAYTIGASQSDWIGIPSATSAGAWYLLLVSDPDDLLGEQDESNNVDSYAISVN